MHAAGWSRRRLVEGLSLLAAFGCAGKQLAITPPGATIDSALDSLRHKLRKHVGDKQRRRRALAKIDALRDVIVEFDHLAHQWRSESLAAIGAGADEAAVLAVAGDINGRVRAQLVRAAKIGFELRADVSAEEWPLVFPAPKPTKTEGKS
jgi:hypothetical protein